MSLYVECGYVEIGYIEGDEACGLADDGRFIGRRKKRRPPEPVPPPDYMKNYSLLTWEGKRARIEAVMHADPEYYRQHLADEYQRVLSHIAMHWRL